VFITEITVSCHRIPQFNPAVDIYFTASYCDVVKGKVFPLQAWYGPEGW